MKIDLKQKAQMTAFTAKNYFQNIYTGVIHTNKTNDEVIKRYAQTLQNNNMTNKRIITDAEEMIVLNDEIKNIAVLGEQMSELTFAKIQDEEIPSNIAAKRLLCNFIFRSKLLDDEISKQIINIINVSR